MPDNDVNGWEFSGNPFCLLKLEIHSIVLHVIDFHDLPIRDPSVVSEGKTDKFMRPNTPLICFLRYSFLKAVSLGLKRFNRGSNRGLNRAR